LFEPAEFAVLARQLVSGSPGGTLDCHAVSPECRLRAALGRAYYALFLAARGVIARKHEIRPRWITHRELHTYLRHSKAGREVQTLGHEMRRLYALRQQAEYEMIPTPEWRRKLADPVYVDLMVKQAVASVSILERLDFSAVAVLLLR
jgi:hypothetical protein